MFYEYGAVSGVGHEAVYASVAAYDYVIGKVDVLAAVDGNDGAQAG